jgi:hypothetical protein
MHRPTRLWQAAWVSTSETVASFFGDRRRVGAPAALPPEPDLTPEQLALITEACTKSGVLWLRPHDADRAVCAWHVWHAGAIHVIYGVDEQMLPLLSGIVEVTVPSKQTRARLLTFLTRADLLPARSPEWEAAADALSAKRLNSHDPASQRERWAAGTLVTRLEPLHVVAAGAGAAEEPSGAAPPPPAAGTTRGDYAPWHLGGRRSRGYRH